MSDKTITLSKGLVEDLETLVDMNFGDYFGVLHDAIKNHESEQERDSAIFTLRQMIRVLYTMGIETGIDVKKFDVDGLLNVYAPDLVE